MLKKSNWWTKLKGKLTKPKKITACQQRNCAYWHSHAKAKKAEPKTFKKKSLKEQAIKFFAILVLFGVFFLFSRYGGNWANKFRAGLAFLTGTFFWAILGILAGALFYSLFKNKGEVVLDNTSEFLEFCKKSNGLVFWGPFGSGKTALMALLAHELPEENKYASFPCNLPWMERAQIDFAYQPTQPLGVKEVIFLDEINLLFKGNEFQQARQKERFLSHFFALSRHQGTKIFINGQRLGQVWIELREVATAVCQVQLLQRTDEGIYVKCEIWQASAWTNEKTEQEFTIFIAKKYLDTYNSYWLKGLKYLRKEQGYV